MVVTEIPEERDIQRNSTAFEKYETHRYNGRIQLLTKISTNTHIWNIILVNYDCESLGICTIYD